MFDSLVPIVNWIFSESTDLARIVWASGWAGICVIAIPLVRKVVDIFKKIL